MTERPRAYWGKQIVTVLDKTVKKRGTAHIRDAFGFTHEVPARELKEIPENEPGSRLRFGDDAA